MHKKDLKGPLTDKKQYLKYINEIFDEDFKSLDEYKEEKNFKRVVEQITLEDIINAIKRAEKIRDHNKELRIDCFKMTILSFIFCNNFVTQM